MSPGMFMQKGELTRLCDALLMLIQPCTSWCHQNGRITGHVLGARTVEGWDCAMPVWGSHDDGLNLLPLFSVGLQFPVLDAAGHAARQLGRLQLRRILTIHLHLSLTVIAPPSDASSPMVHMDARRCALAACT